jgi:enoyl-CoA hydratase
MLTAARALEIGLVDEVFAADQLLAKTMEFATLLSGKAPLALGLAKLVLNACANVDPDTGRQLERLGQSILKKTEDHEEGARAFVEKRRPKFKGK